MGIATKEIELFERRIHIETGKMAKQADEAVLVTCEGTSVLATVVVSGDIRPVDFLPLTVDFEEKLYAAGKIPGSFFRREGRPTTTATLNARIIDRSLRPNFDKNFRNEIQVVLTVLSTDQENPPDMLGLIGASTVLSLSNIPFAGPMAGVRVGRRNGDWLINPTHQEQADSELNLVISGNSEAVVMVEAEATEVPEEMVIEALSVGHDAIRKLVSRIEELDRESREGSGEKPKEETLAEIFGFVEPVYRQKASEYLKAYEDGNPEAIDSCAREMDEVVDKAIVEFPSRYRKVVGICSYITMQKTLYELLSERIGPEIKPRLKSILVEASKPQLTKSERSLIRKDARRDIGGVFLERYCGLEGMVKKAIEAMEYQILRQQILEDNIRPDGRKSFQIRKITCEVGLLPKTHGSGLFTRGETQVLTVATLGAYGEKQILDDLGIEESKGFIHHYNFPPYSSGEARPLRGPRRREIGHGALAERALLPLIPDENEFPYTIRLVSEVLESNGSTSMASVCAGSLALMDAGVPMKGDSHVGGIAMGLVVEEGEYVILSDILGLEDAIGDMDFKVAGTRNGINALQMDIKCSGITTELLKEALEQARQARSFIIKAMTGAIESPRSEVSPNAPKMIQIEVPVDKIGDVIGPGGKNIRGLIEKYEVEIDVENDGRVFIFGRDRVNAERAKKDILMVTKEPEVGERFLGTVVKTTNFGAFVELVPGKDGLIHISKLSRGHVDRVEDVVNVGDKVEVEIDEIDNLGRINLKAIDLNPATK